MRFSLFISTLVYLNAELEFKGQFYVLPLHSLVSQLIKSL
jgi:hypothetical protein